MAQYFKNPVQLLDWVKERNVKDAFHTIKDVVLINSGSEEDNTSIKEAIQSIHDGHEYAANSLFQILEKYNLTESNFKQGVYMKKEAQSRQRNDWYRGERNKWNRMVAATHENTPWRVDRDEFFNFTHYTTDAIRFDADPNRVYSGEALWRMYVMDKFYREHKTEDGKWVGGYVNDRFYTFPDAGTPANPDVPRDGGNQMQLGLSEKARKPRPHQYSTEKRLEVARGNEVEDDVFTTTANVTFNTIVKTASQSPSGRHEDVVYNIMTDCIEMKEAGVQYENMIDLISNHYNKEVTDVAQIAKFAEKMVEKHDQVAYTFDLKKKVIANRETLRTISDLNVQLMDPSGKMIPNTLLEGTVLVRKDPNIYEIASGKGIGQQVFIETDMQNLSQQLDSQDELIQDAADELGLNETGEQTEDPMGSEAEMHESFEINEF